MDTHPNAVAVRLKLALLVIESGAKIIPWQKATAHSESVDPQAGEMDFVVEDMTNYIAKHVHVSDICRLNADEEYQLLDWLKGKFPQRLRYIELLKAVNEEPPGNIFFQIFIFQFYLFQFLFLFFSSKIFFSNF